MAKSVPQASYRVYWFTWVVLLALTLGMLVTGYLPLPKAFILLLLILAMLTKASLIGAHFMHLRFEKFSLVLMVGAGILATAAILFLLISFDGIRILRLSAP
ncbi:MAG: cytochrome C oxidase subunit IV family protein [Acidobacteriota bacterium]